MNWVLNFKLGSLERGVILDPSAADLLQRSDSFLLLAMCASFERRNDASFGWRSGMDLELQPKDARTWNEAEGEQLRP